MPESLGVGIGIFGVVWVLMFVGILGAFVYFIVRGIGQWSYNNAQPVQSVPAAVVTKRTGTSGGSGNTSVSTWYYATFEMDGGERREFGMPGGQYGLLAEGDRGTLTYQGTRFKGFARE